jgi:hypothetical protein
LWRRIVDSFIDYEKDRDKRQEDFSDYLYYGRTPKYLKEALENDYKYSSIEIKPELTSSSLFAHSIIAITMDNPENVNMEEEIQSFQKIDFSHEFDTWIPMVSFYWSVPNLKLPGTNTFLQVGMGVWHFYIKKTTGDVINSFIPSYVIGFFNGLSEKSLKNSNFSYMVDLLMFDNDKYEHIEKTLGVGINIKYKLFKSLWLSSYLSYYPEVFIQYGAGIGILF